MIESRSTQVQTHLTIDLETSKNKNSEKKYFRQRVIHSSIEALNSVADGDETLRPLSRARHSLVFQKNEIFMRDINEPSGWKIYCLSSAGGGQGNALTGSPFVARIGPD
jgi:hypothetical protein